MSCQRIALCPIYVLVMFCWIRSGYVPSMFRLRFFLCPIYIWLTIYVLVMFCLIRCGYTLFMFYVRFCLCSIYGSSYVLSITFWLCSSYVPSIFLLCSDHNLIYVLSMVPAMFRRIYSGYVESMICF